MPKKFSEKVEVTSYVKLDLTVSKYAVEKADEFTMSYWGQRAGPAPVPGAGTGQAVITVAAVVT
jgi:hypothetical protein